MKLSKEGLKAEKLWQEAGISLPNYDIEAVCKKTKEAPIWVHFGAGNIFRQFIGGLQDTLLNKGKADKGIVCVETFDYDYRENILFKGIDEKNPAVIAKNFDEVCLLFGLDGQTYTSMKHDIETGLTYFERVCVNIMVENSTKIKPNAEVIKLFMQELYPLYKDNERIDILIENTDFGVG